LGEFLALAVALEDVGQKTNNAAALLLAATLDQASGQYLDQGKSPSAKVNELDNRGSHFYLAMYWAQALVAQDQNLDLQAKFRRLAQDLISQESNIVAELKAVQGGSIDIGGYYHPNSAKTIQAMRPSTTLNKIIASFTVSTFS
jgi:isocitrate dehydrogenase